MFETLFGSEIPLAARFFIAFLVVLALIGLTAWLVRRFGSNRLGGAPRGRQPRLAVIDAASVDGRRRLVLIRRDNVEHLLMIGGPTDVVVEQNIVRAAGGRETVREPARVATPAAAEPAIRQTPNGENSWPLQPSNEPAQIAPPRPSRSAATEEPWLAPEPGARPRPADSSLTGLAAELSSRLSLPEAAARGEPTPRPNAAPLAPSEPESAKSSHGDQNLADMAQQLEAALRRTPMPESRPPVTDPLVASAKPAPAREFRSRIEPKFEPVRENKSETKAESKTESKTETKSEPKLETAVEPKVELAPSKAPFDNLEEEMANLLGRPPGKT